MAQYNGSVELISGIKQANNGNFPLVNASAVQVDDTDKRLDVALAELNEKLENDYLKADDIQDKYYDKATVDDIISQLSYDPETGVSTTVSWKQILDKPESLSEYGVKTEVQDMIDESVKAANVEIDEDELNAMLVEVLGE